MWNVIYPLQIVGVCVSLAAIYPAGITHPDDGPIRKMVILLGQYSLFAYIAQIIILQGLRRNWLLLSPGGAA